MCGMQERIVLRVELSHYLHKSSGQVVKSADSDGPKLTLDNHSVLSQIVCNVPNRCPEQ